MNIFITGATGNIGSEIIPRFAENPHGINVYAAVRNPEQIQERMPEFKTIQCRRFDFLDPNTFGAALSGVDIVFLLRPPHLANVDKYFAPFIQACVNNAVSKVVFLSVQGAEKAPIIPHRKIELLLEKEQLDCIFLRPSYFMQNLTTAFLQEIHKYRSISLPAGNGLFNWIDIADIADLAYELILNFETYKNQALVVTGQENLDFAQVVERINQWCGTSIAYRSVSPWRYLYLKHAEGMNFEMSVVTMVLHFMPRLSGPPIIFNTLEKILGRKPNSLENFILKNRFKFI